MIGIVILFKKLNYDGKYKQYECYVAVTCNIVIRGGVGLCVLIFFVDVFCTFSYVCIYFFKNIF